MKATFINVIVKIVYAEKIGSFYIPDQAKRDRGEYRGEVKSVGPDVTLDIKIGDKILFERNEGKEIEEDGVKYMVLHQDYILGKEE